MGFFGFLESWISNQKTEPASQGVDTITIDIPPDMYYQAMAVYTAKSLLANAIGRSEFLVYKEGKQVQNEDYYVLNVSPNINQTATEFWHDVIDKMYGEKNAALVVEANGRLYCADSWYISQERPLLGNVYHGVTVKNFTFDKSFRAEEVYLFRIDNEKFSQILTGMNRRYGELVATAVKAFETDGAQKFKLHIEATKENDKEFEEIFRNRIVEQLKAFLKRGSAVYVEFDGYKLENLSSGSTTPISSVSAKNILEIKNDMFNTVADALKIPRSLMSGNINNVKDVSAEFLTYGVDPIAQTLQETLNKRAGFRNWLKGNRYEVSTRNITHRDILELGAAVNQLISSSTMNIDEVRKEIGLPVLNTDWSKQYFITKNYTLTENMVDAIESGKNIDEQNKTNIETDVEGGDDNAG